MWIWGKPRRHRYPHLAVAVHLNEHCELGELHRTFAQLTGEPVIMRTVFTIELKCDIDTEDDERRAAFIDLVTNSAQQIYGVASMLAGKTAPVMNVSRVDREGKEALPLFEDPHRG